MSTRQLALTLEDLKRRERERVAALLLPPGDGECDRIIAPPLLPPHDRVRDHAADQLVELLTDDAAGALVDACHDAEVRDAVAHLLRLLVARRDGRRRS